MLGFLEAREKAFSDGMKLGSCMVFFGCRAENDYLHKERMRSWADMGVISDLQVAFVVVFQDATRSMYKMLWLGIEMRCG